MKLVLHWLAALSIGAVLGYCVCALLSVGKRGPVRRSRLIEQGGYVESPPPVDRVERPPASPEGPTP